MPGIFPGFILNVVLNGTTIEFEPDARSYSIVVLNAFDKLLDSVMIVPHVETKLYPSESAHASKPNLKPVIDSKIVEGAKAEVSVWVGGWVDVWVCAHVWMLAVHAYGTESRFVCRLGGEKSVCACG